MEVKDRERFPDSRPAREQPFRMYNDNKVITVKLTDLEEGWEFDKTNDTQVTLTLFQKSICLLLRLTDGTCFEDSCSFTHELVSRQIRKYTLF